MQYIDTTSSYNDRRYGKPWMAIVTTSLTRGFDFLDWAGFPGSAGRFVFSADPGTMVAYGQKDIRKGKGGVDGYQMCMPDGTMPIISGSTAAEILSMDLDARWQHVARIWLAKAVNRPAESWKISEWEATRNEKAARYSAILGIADPIMAETAKAFGLTEEPKAESVNVPDMGAFGF